MTLRALLIRCSTVTIAAVLLSSSAVFSAPQLEKSFQVAAESEVLLDLTASVSGTSWAQKGNEAAVATLLRDRRLSPKSLA